MQTQSQLAFVASLGRNFELSLSAPAIDPAPPIQPALSPRDRWPAWTNEVAFWPTDLDADGIIFDQGRGPIYPRYTAADVSTETEPTGPTAEDDRWLCLTEQEDRELDAHYDRLYAIRQWEITDCGDADCCPGKIG